MKANKHTKLYEWQIRAREGNVQCNECGSKNSITVDHIIPVSIIEQLSLDFETDTYYLTYDDEANFQYLCRYCNSKKANKLDVRNPKTIILLKKIIENIEKLSTDNLTK